MHIVKRLAFFVTRQAKVLERWQIVWKILVLPNKSPRSDPPGEKKASLRFASSLIHFPGPSLLKAFVCQASSFFFFFVVVFVFPPIPSFQLLMMLSSRKVQASRNCWSWGKPHHCIIKEFLRWLIFATFEQPLWEWMTTLKRRQMSRSSSRRKEETLFRRFR